MLEVKNISAGYTKKPVLNNVSTAFEKGKLTSIIGINGCGKSTLLKAMLGILPITQGEIAIDGRSLHTMRRAEIAQKLAFLPQGKATPEMTVAQMVLHGRFPYLSYPRRYSAHDKALAAEAMKAVGIYAQADSPLYALSGGMRQNAYIAMALAQDTEYILLDEPTTYLDISHQLALMRLLRSLLEQGKGIITVMHDLPMAFTFSDHILLLHNGSIQSEGTPEAICASPHIQSVFGVTLEPDADKRAFCITMHK